MSSRQEIYLQRMQKPTQESPEEMPAENVLKLTITFPEGAKIRETGPLTWVSLADREIAFCNDKFFLPKEGFYLHRIEDGYQVMESPMVRVQINNIVYFRFKKAHWSRGGAWNYLHQKYPNLPFKKNHSAYHWEWATLVQTGTGEHV